MLSTIMSHADQILDIAAKTVALASAVAFLTPTPKDDTVVGKVYKVVDFCALNWGKAKQLGNVAAAMSEANRLMDAGNPK